MLIGDSTRERRSLAARVTEQDRLARARFPDASRCSWSAYLGEKGSEADAGVLLLLSRPGCGQQSSFPWPKEAGWSRSTLSRRVPADLAVRVSTLGGATALPQLRTQRRGSSRTADSGSQPHPLAAHSQELQIKEREKRMEKREEDV